MATKDYSEIFKEKSINYIQFQFTTIFGEFKGVDFPVEIWDIMKDGTGIDGSSLGFLKTEQSDMKIVPDLNTFAIIPWNSKVGRFICDVTDNKGKAYPTCPRGILKRILEKSVSFGYDFLTRPELEWYFITTDRKPADTGTYMDIPPKDQFSELRLQISSAMMKMGIGIKTIHHEVGPSQHEIEFLPNNALNQADNVQTAKVIIKNEAKSKSLISTFMPKPFPLVAGSGLHIHQYLEKDGKNIFANANAGISDLLRYYIGGIQKHADAISVILNPITNSYKRLIPNHEAPVHISWGIGNRTALIRVPGYEKSVRIEYRAGDATMNIYLGTALLLAAGLDGIKKKIEPNTPVTENIDSLTTEERQTLGIKKLPQNLSEALESFGNSKFILKNLGKQLVNIFMDIKSREIEDYQMAENEGKGSEWELENYLLL
ncbi:MAG: glutamine synthetase [Candidatus Lokiarchaeota archaeon]|nr:glutamine synthetase [Candidatus Lokiarchaeota archaeon]